MRYQVQYRLDAHAYDPARWRCVGTCSACRAELQTYDDLLVAEAAQPAHE